MSKFVNDWTIDIAAIPALYLDHYGWCFPPIVHRDGYVLYVEASVEKGHGEGLVWIIDTLFRISPYISYLDNILIPQDQTVR